MGSRGFGTGGRGQHERGRGRGVRGRTQGGGRGGGEGGIGKLGDHSRRGRGFARQPPQHPRSTNIRNPRDARKPFGSPSFALSAAHGTKSRRPHARRDHYKYPLQSYRYEHHTISRFSSHAPIPAPPLKRRQELFLRRRGHQAATGKDKEVGKGEQEAAVDLYRWLRLGFAWGRQRERDEGDLRVGEEEGRRSERYKWFCLVKRLGVTEVSCHERKDGEDDEHDEDGGAGVGMIARTAGQDSEEKTRESDKISSQILDE